MRRANNWKNMQDVPDAGADWLTTDILIKKRALNTTVMNELIATLASVTALAAVIGALVTYYLTIVQDLAALLVPFAAGGFIYVAATDLMPELHKKSQARVSLIQLVSIIFGIALMAYLKIALAG